MNRCFLDTSFLIALVASDDSLHDRALAWQPRLPRERVTTEFVLVELADAFCSSGPRRAAVAIIAALRGDPHLIIHRASADLVDAGLALFASRPDKDWGLTDCISFVVMERDGLKHALTADRHVEQAGFEALLR